MRLPSDLSIRDGSSTSSPSETLPGPLDSIPSISAEPSATSTPAPGSQTKSGPSNTVLIAAFSATAGLFVALILYCVLKTMRRKHQNPKYIPTKFLKNRWASWRPVSTNNHRYVSTEIIEPTTESSAPSTTRQGLPPSSLDAAGVATVRNSQAGSAIDRNTSVRSVMTLPPYMPKPAETEQVLGREGERGGIDIVIEYPESAEEEEELRREEEMEALYQVRLARRTEATEREERRRLRREARERNDWVALEELRTRSRAASGASVGRSIDELREEHARIRDRQRAVSSVSYADLGIARHDGTRLRANSEESERPLLGDAASIAASSHRHRRDRSASSVLSIDTMGSDFPSPGITRSRANSRPDSARRVSAQAGSMSSPELVDHEEGQDVGDEGIPGYEPPEYENIALEDGQEPPPEYRSPVETRAPEPQSATTTPTLTPVISRFSAASRERDPVHSPDSRSPQLSNLRSQALPSIVVDIATPVNPRGQEGTG